MVWIQQHHNAKLIGQIFNISHVLGWCSFMHKLISLSNIFDYNKRIEGHLCICCCCWLHIKLCSSWNSLSTKWESGWFMISLWIFRPWYAQMKNDGAMDKQLPICGRMGLQSWKISIGIISSLFFPVLHQNIALLRNLVSRVLVQGPRNHFCSTPTCASSISDQSLNTAVPLFKIIKKKRSKKLCTSSFCRLVP